jgi:hypothetical protein
LKNACVIWADGRPTRYSLAIDRYKVCEPKIAIAIAGATHENRIFRGDGVIEELDNPVDVGVIINPALGKESGECVERRPSDALQGDMVGKKECIAEGLIVGELLRTRE